MIVISQSILIHLILIMVVAMPGVTMVKGFGFFTAFQRRRIIVSRQNPSAKKHQQQARHVFTPRFHNSRSTSTEEEEEEEEAEGSSFSSRDFSTTTFKNPSEKQKMTRALLSSLIQRSSRTLAYKASSSSSSSSSLLVDTSKGMNENDDHDGNSLFAVDLAVQDILDTAAAAVAAVSDENANNNKNQEEEEVRVGYNQNPTITSTALAHVLWSHVLLRQNVGVVDSHKNLIAIDATAGNGADSVALARMLFLQDNHNNNKNNNNNKLISIDIQSEACETTRNELAKILPRDVLENQVDIHQGSHASLLPLLDNNTTTNSNSKNVALVVYNLGFLPNSTSSMLTCTESTILSMADAVLSIRIGGLLSVMTYPRTNREEDWAVRVFLEGLALFSSNTDDWQEFVATSFSSSSSTAAPRTTTTTSTAAVSMETHRQQEAVRRLILETLMRIKNEGAPNQTWRVHEYKKLGWRDAPILLTASRIK